MTKPPTIDIASEKRLANHRPAKSYFFTYLSPTAVANIPEYKYSGCDNSVIYQKLLSPFLNDALAAGYVPSWLHPNAITVSGLVLMIIAHIATAIYCPSFTEDAPSWVYLLNAGALFLYWVLDALDGKQARKTGSSSPLGLLMDHGCDALNTTVGTLNTIAALKIGPGLGAYMMHSLPCAVFFAATWEEYFVGSLNLAVINGPNEGIWLGILFQLISAAFGNSFWTEQTFGVARNTIVLATLTVVCTCTILMNAYNVFAAVAHIQKGHRFLNDIRLTPSQIQAGTNWVAFTRAVPLIAMLLVSSAWAQLSPTDLFHRHPRFFMWVQGLLLCKLVMTMMVAHLADEAYHPFGKTFSGVLALAVHSAVIYSMVGISAGWEDLILYELGAAVGISYIHMVMCLVWEVATVLDINVFTMTKRAS
ncbi:putative CDP-alcohol phosphatidyltransferase class-I family protein 3 [Diplonema papillatum]|nr:putative CDP-alcohol phosphatidyltransferase class-I family protein 3 [Diplonema papillatum]